MFTSGETGWPELYKQSRAQYWSPCLYNKGKWYGELLHPSVLYGDPGCIQYIILCLAYYSHVVDKELVLIAKY